MALGWVASRWPGLLTDTRRVLPDLKIADRDLDAGVMLDRAIELARTRQPLPEHPLLGHVALGLLDAPRAAASAVRSFGRMPWTTTQKRRPAPTPCPSAGTAVCGTPTCHRRADRTTTTWTSPQTVVQVFPTPNGMRGQKASCQTTSRFSNARVPVAFSKTPVSADLRKWFEEHTHRAMTNRLEDGSDLDVDSYVGHYVDLDDRRGEGATHLSRTCCHAAATSRRRCCSTPVHRWEFTAAGSSAWSWRARTRCRMR